MANNENPNSGAQQEVQIHHGDPPIILRGPGYTMEVFQYSNKGPLTIIKDEQGREVGRGWFDLFTRKWHTRTD